MTPTSPPSRILVVKLGALGDFILAFPAFQAIRKHHPDSAITLLTTVPFVELAEASPWFDRIVADRKPKLDPAGWMRLARFFNGGKFDRVYDLQTSGRSGLYYRLFLKKPEWAGIAKGCSHPDPTPDRAAVHAFDLRVNQLHAAGIDDVPPADLSWLTSGSRFALPANSVLLVPGASPHRPEKRWPASSYAALAVRLRQRGYVPVILGAADAHDAARTILSAAPGAVDLTGRTILADFGDLARDAVAAVGNDTGPMHLIAAVGCPSVVLFSAASNPGHSSPRGQDVRVLRRDDLATLAVADVESMLNVASEDCHPAT